MKTAALFVASLYLLLAAGPVSAYPSPDTSSGLFQDGTVLVGFQPGTSPAQRASAVAAVNAVDVRTIGASTHVLIVGRGRVMEVITGLEHNPFVRYAEPDYFEWPAGAPNDSNFSKQWGFQNTGQTIAGVTGTAGADERAVPAWAVTTGTAGSSVVVVAVVDTGVQYNHPDLETNMWSNPGTIGNCPAGTHGYNVLAQTCSPMDDDTVYAGHGTHIAGIIGAATNNATGVAGLNWTTQIMAVKWIPSSGAGLTSNLITALQWVINAKQAGVNIRIVNDSGTWSGTAFSQALSDEIDALGSNDILFVTAAGNTAQDNDTTPRYPCSYGRANEICVGATDQNDNLWSSSNYGIGTVDLAAPGTNIYSTLRSTNYGIISGTSMSAGEVSGAAALILSMGYQDVATLKSMILNNVDVLPGLAAFVRTSGRLNVCKAVPGCSTATIASPVNTAAPQVVGTPQFGQQVGAWTGMWTGSPKTFTYQWSRCDGTGANCAPIGGATSATYAVLANADVGSTLFVTVQAANSSGTSGMSSPLSSVVASATPSTWSVASTIQDGTAISGQLLWQATPSLPSTSVNNVQFYIDGRLRSIAFVSPYNYGSNGTLDTATLSQGPHVLALRAVANDLTDAYYSAAVIVGNPPINTTRPVISGKAVAGQSLITSTGSWSNSPTSYAYQWNRCDSSGANCSAILGATTNTYVLTGTDVGSTIRSAVTATNQFGSTTALSNATAIVAANAPVITTASSLPSGVQNTPYTTTLTGSGGVTPYTWSIVGGSLPAGLVLAADTGTISGTPTGFGTSTFTVQLQDALSQTTTQTFSLIITPAGVSGTIGLVQSASVQAANTKSISLAFPANNTQGNLIIVFVRASTTGQSVVVTDTVGNTYLQAIKQTQTTDGHQIRIFYCTSLSSSSNIVTATFSNKNARPWLAVFEYTGVSTLDTAAGAQGTGALPNTGLTALTTAGNELVFSGLGLPSSSSATVTPGFGFALLQQDTITKGSRAATEAQIVSATGQFAGTYSLSASANWSAVIATFK